jgi:hypothetical protein
MKRHGIDLIALLFGLAFLGAGAAFLTHELSDRPIDVAWVSAIGFVVLGVVALASTVLRRPHDDEPTEIEEIETT